MKWYSSQFQSHEEAATDKYIQINRPMHIQPPKGNNNKSGDINEMNKKYSKEKRKIEN